MKQAYKDFIRDAESSNEYWIETAISDFTEEVVRIMKEKNISRTSLAERLDASPAYVTKVLRGNANFTLSTMTKLARAVGMVVRIHLAPDGVIVRWVEESPANINEGQPIRTQRVFPMTGTGNTVVIPPAEPQGYEIRAASSR